MVGKHRWQRKPVILTIAAVLVAAGAVGAWATTHRTADAATGTTSTVAATVATLKQTVSATGTIEPKTRSDLSFASSGTVTSVDVAVGDTVTAGQRLATIDPTQLQTALTLAQAGLDSASAQLDVGPGDRDGGPDQRRPGPGGVGHGETGHCPAGPHGRDVDLTDRRDRRDRQHLDRHPGRGRIVRVGVRRRVGVRLRIRQRVVERVGLRLGEQRPDRRHLDELLGRQRRRR